MSTFLRIRLPGLIIFLVAAFGLSAQACCPPVLLTIDVTNPFSVVITATGSAAAIRDCSTTEGDGIDLLQFFNSSVAACTSTDCGGDLIPSGGCLAYNAFTPDNASCCFGNFDLNFYNNSNTVDIQSFNRCDSAFTGCWTIDLSEFACSLPCVGTTGDIMVGYSDSRNGTGNTIGLWQIVSAPIPEPSQYGFFICLAVGALVLSRRLPLFRRG